MFRIFEDTEEYDKIVSTAEDQVAKLEEGIQRRCKPRSGSCSPTHTRCCNSQCSKVSGWAGPLAQVRRNRLRGKRYDVVPYSANEIRPSPKVIAPEAPPTNVQEFPSILPGESLARISKVYDIFKGRQLARRGKLDRSFIDGSAFRPRPGSYNGSPGC